MRTVGPALTRAAAFGTAAAAVGVLAFTAYVDTRAGERPARSAPAPTVHPSTPIPDSTLPGSVDEPTDGPTAPHVSAARKRAWLRGLAGTWTRNGRQTYFRFHADGSGEWVAFGQKLWTGTATPRAATRFDLSDPDGHGGAYWQVRLLGHRKLLFAGTRQTFTRS